MLQVYCLFLVYLLYIYYYIFLVLFIFMNTPANTESSLRLFIIGVLNIFS